MQMGVRPPVPAACSRQLAVHIRDGKALRPQVGRSYQEGVHLAGEREAILGRQAVVHVHGADARHGWVLDQGHQVLETLRPVEREPLLPRVAQDFLQERLLGLESFRSRGGIHSLDEGRCLGGRHHGQGLWLLAGQLPGWHRGNGRTPAGHPSPNGA